MEVPRWSGKTSHFSRKERPEDGGAGIGVNPSIPGGCRQRGGRGQGGRRGPGPAGLR